MNMNSLMSYGNCGLLVQSKTGIKIQDTQVDLYLLVVGNHIKIGKHSTGIFLPKSLQYATGTDVGVESKGSVGIIGDNGLPFPFLHIRGQVK